MYGDSYMSITCTSLLHTRDVDMFHAINYVAMTQTGQWVPLSCLTPACDADGKHSVTEDGCKLFIWQGQVYEERDANSLTWSDYGQEWDVMLCMQPYE